MSARRNGGIARPLPPTWTKRARRAPASFTKKCHACGQDWPTDMARPLCIDCLRRCGGLLVAQGHRRQCPKNGVCIRDGAGIEFDLSKPYCGKRFRSWNRFKNREYQEKKCHICGRDGPSSMDRPVCADCYLNVAYLAFVGILDDNYIPFQATPPTQDYYDEDIWDFGDDYDFTW